MLLKANPQIVVQNQNKGVINAIAVFETIDTNEKFLYQLNIKAEELIYFSADTVEQMSIN